MDAKNIFGLIGQFSGIEEDQLTASFGALLANSPALLFAFFKKIGIRINKRRVEDIKIETQVWSDYNNRLYLRISWNGTLIYIENKLTAPTTKKQIRDYLADLNEKEQRKKLFLLISSTNEEEMLQKIVKKSSLKKVKNLRWNDILELIKGTSPEKDKKFLFNQFIEQWGEIMKGKIDISEQKINDVEEVMVVVVEPDCMDYIKRTGVYIPPGAQAWRPVQYVAFYVSNPVKEVKFLAKVKEMRYEVRGNQLPKGYYPTNRNTIIRQVIYLEDPIELSKRLGRGSENMNIWRGQYTTVTKLMDNRTKTLSDLKK